MRPSFRSKMRKLPRKDEMDSAFRGDILRLGRQARKVTQTQLSKSSGLSQSFVSMVEDQLRTPTDEQALALGAALNFPVEFFHLCDPVLGTGVGEIFHRKRKSIAKKEIDSIHAWMNIKTIALRRLVSPIEWPEIDLPSNSVALSPEDTARRLRASWYVTKGPVQSVSRLLQGAGVLIVPLETNNQRIDAIGQWTADLPPLIFVNPNIPQDRLRFTLLHELGHLVLHQRATNLSLNESIEEEANMFAAEFLMPAKDIKKDLRQLDIQRLAPLKLKWRTAMQALLIRAEQLGVNTPATSKRLWGEIGRNGWRTSEPTELEVRGEEPFARYDELLWLYQSQLNYSPADVGRVVSLHPFDIEEHLIRNPVGLRLVT